MCSLWQLNCDAGVWCLVLFLFFQMVVSESSSRTICCTQKVVIYASPATNLLRPTCLGTWETSTSAVTSNTNVRFATPCLPQKMPFKFILEGIMALNTSEAWTLSNVSYILSSFPARIWSVGSITDNCLTDHRICTSSCWLFSCLKASILFCLVLLFQMSVSRPSSRTIYWPLMAASFVNLVINFWRVMFTGMWEINIST